ncbi:MAG: hypothetical protein C0501_21335 [Isosphaera sp.]|nr:hypothetical protein [Isosphaera sp.]
MSDQIDVVYEHGPLGPLPEGIREHLRLTVTIEDAAPAVPGPDAGDDTISLDAVRQALSKVPGSLAAAVIADRS